MKLSRALKEKNRLASEVKRLLVILIRENSRRNDNESKINAEEIYNEYISTRDKLIKIKSAIAKANINIYEKISRMEELKSTMTSLDMISTRVGEEIVQSYGDTENLKYIWTSFIDNEKRDNLKIEIQIELNKLQDTIDDYNSSTEVNI